jgi:signal transduction histidine kinase
MRYALKLSRVFSNPLISDPLAGMLLGFFLLHPLAMAVVGAPFVAAHGERFLHALLDPMGFYFAAIGLVSGLVSGSLRRALAGKNKRLQESRRVVEEILLEKESLLRILTHDLTNTIVSATAYAKIVQRRSDALTKEEIVQNISEIRISLEQAHELMEFTRKILAIQSGKIEMPLQVHDLCPLAEESVHMFREFAHQKGVEIRLVSGDEPVMAVVEPVIFKNSILNNLMSNAIKFSLPGETAEIALRREGNVIKVSVSNKGPCILAHAGKDLFVPTIGTSTPGTMGERGTGFGLPLVEQFIKKMHGSVHWESVPMDPKGVCRTTFELSLQGGHKSGNEEWSGS